MQVKDERAEKVKDLTDAYPMVPAEIFDIEASEEMAEMYLDYFGI